MQKAYGAIQLIGWVFGIPILIACVLSTVPALTSPSWPTVPGIVRNAAYAHSNRAGDHWEISIAYKAEDTAYSCHRVVFSPSSVTSGQVDRHPQGSQAQVHYKPSDPSKCVLEPGVSLPLGLTWIMAIALLALAKFARSKTKSRTVTTPLQLPSEPVHMPEGTRLADVAALAAKGQTIEAIALYRRITGAGLREAKDYLDTLQGGWNKMFG